MKNRIFHFKGVVQDRNETKNQKKKRLQREFLASYTLYKQSNIK